MSPWTQSRAEDDAHNEGEMRGAEPRCMAALGSTRGTRLTAARAAADYSNYPPLAPSPTAVQI